MNLTSCVNYPIDHRLEGKRLGRNRLKMQINKKELKQETPLEIPITKGVIKLTRTI